MCTVSFYRSDKQAIITSNRDEHISRPSAHSISKYTYHDKTLFFPKDPQAGGTWFVTDLKGNVFVLLNGAEAKHTPEASYRRSRGLILLDIISSDYFFDSWFNIDLSNIEPFTIIAYNQGLLTKLTWNSKYKSDQSLNPERPYIWSSVTLYDKVVIKNRQLWFSEFLNYKQQKVDKEDLIKFHTNTEKNDLNNGLMINRENTMLTKNVTQCVIEENKFTLFHYDLLNSKKSKLIEFIK